MNARSPLWTSDEAARATGGKTNRDWSVHGVSIDTRSIERGDLFVALQGDSRDGHGFVAAALENGAAAALVSRVPDGVTSGAPLLIVGDTQKGLEDLGRAARARSHAKIVAVTGSAGKTTTKEMLRLMLSTAAPVAASAASYNNHWGVPLSLARMKREAPFGVFEIGMNHAGEIRALNAFVRPHVALITTIAPAHLEYFGNVEAIADAKAEIFEGVEPGGAAILPADNPQYDRLKAHALDAGVKRILTFGTRSNADARLLSADPHGEGQKIVAELGGNRLAFSAGAGGAHIAMNAMAALLAARELGVDIKTASQALGNFVALKGRGARFAAGDIDVIDESYNANPASMIAALGLLGQTRPKPHGRRIAVLGDMLELGVDSAPLHAALAKDIAAAAADLVFLCGPHMAALWQAVPERKRGAYAELSSELGPELMRNLRAGDVVLVKGSFGSRMSVIIDALKSREAATA